MAKRDSHSSSIEPSEVRNQMVNLLNSLSATISDTSTKQAEEKITNKVSDSIEKGVRQGVKNAKKQTVNLDEKIDIKSNDAAYKKQIEGLIQKRAKTIEEVYKKSEEELQQKINNEIAKNKDEIAKVNKERQDSFKKAINRTKPKMVSVTKDGKKEQVDFVKYYQQKIDKDEITLSDNYILQQKRAIKKKISDINKATYPSSIQGAMDAKRQVLENELQELEKTPLVLDNELSFEEIKKIKARISKNKNKLINGLIEEAQTLLDAATTNKEENDKAEDLLRLLEEQEVFYKQKGEALPKKLTTLRKSLQGQYKKVSPQLLQESRTGAQWAIDNAVAEKDNSITDATKKIDSEIKTVIKQRIDNLSAGISKQMSQADYDEVSAALSDTINSAVEVGLGDYAQGVAKSIQKQLGNVQIVSDKAILPKAKKQTQTKIDSNEIDKQIEAKREMIGLLKDSIELESKDNQAVESYTAEIQKQEAELEGLLELQKSISKTTDSNINISSGKLAFDKLEEIEKWSHDNVNAQLYPPVIDYVDTIEEIEESISKIKEFKFQLQKIQETDDGTISSARQDEIIRTINWLDQLIETENKVIETKKNFNAQNETPVSTQPIEAQTEALKEEEKQAEATAEAEEKLNNERNKGTTAPSAKALSERINSRIRKNTGKDLSKDELASLDKYITETITLMENLGYNTDKVKSRYEEFKKSISGTATEISNAVEEIGTATTTSAEKASEGLKDIAESGEKVETPIIEATEAIKEEGRAAEKSAAQKNEFVEANKKVAESGEKTEKATKKAAKGVKIEGTEIEKERAEFERLLQSSKLLGTRHTYDIDSQGHQYSHERSFTTETTLGRKVKQTLVPEYDDDGKPTGEFGIAYEQATDYAKIVKEATKATLDLQKARHNLLLESQKQNPNQDNINSFILQVTDAQQRLDEATNSAEQFAQEISHFYNDRTYGSKYIMPMFNRQVGEQVEYRRNAEDVRYNNAMDSMEAKAQKDAESAIDSIQRLNNYLSTTKEYVNNIQATYDKSIDPNLKRAVTDTSDLLELDQRRRDILAEIARLENSDPATANLQPLKNMLTQYQREIRIKQNAGRNQIKDTDLPTYIKKEDNVISDLIKQSKLYGNSTKFVTDELEHQLQILRLGAVNSDQFYDVQDVRKYYQAILDGIKATEVATVKELSDSNTKGKSLVDWWNLSGSTKPLTQDIQNQAKDAVAVIQPFLKTWEKIVNGEQGIDIITDQEKTDLKNALDTLNQIRKQYTLPKNQEANQNTIFKALSQVNKMLSENTKSSFRNTSVYKDLRQLQYDLKHFDSNNAQEAVKELSARLLELRSRLEDLPDEIKGNGFFQKIAKGISTQTTQAIARYFSFYDIIRYTRTAFNTIQELDTALVDLRKTTTMSTADLNEFYFEANNVAKQLGVTTAEVINQASAWSRLNKIGPLYSNI